ncbi:hypothetical protein HY486_03150 [Candidatus Woesearchaeota archaeon]|nr:hypothetical protein [Candidatus Woesearchaeota archaeon]
MDTGRKKYDMRELGELRERMIHKADGIFLIHPCSTYVANIPVNPPVFADSVQELKEALRKGFIGEGGVEWGRFIVQDDEELSIHSVHHLEELTFSSTAVVVAVQPQIPSVERGQRVIEHRDAYGQIIGFSTAMADFIQATGKYQGEHPLDIPESERWRFKPSKPAITPTDIAWNIS